MASGDEPISAPRGGGSTPRPGGVEVLAVQLEFVDVLLLVLIVYLVWLMFIKPCVCPRQRDRAREERAARAAAASRQAEEAPLRLTPAALRAFGGGSSSSSAGGTAGESSGQQRLLLSVRGRVYDVSSRPDLYGAGGEYALFAGRECARALAKEVVSEEELDRTDLDGLFASQRANLVSWEHTLSKYPVVGELVADGAAASATTRLKKRSARRRQRQDCRETE